MNKTQIVGILIVGLGLLATGCAGPRPINQWAVADMAMKAAREAGAQSSAPGFYHKAEDNYLKGKKSLKGNYNKEAKVFFIRAQKYAEKAENAARLKKFKSGEGFL